MRRVSGVFNCGGRPEVTQTGARTTGRASAEERQNCAAAHSRRCRGQFALYAEPEHRARRRIAGEGVNGMSLF